MEKQRWERALTLLCEDFSRFTPQTLQEMERDLELARGQLAARRYTLAGDNGRVRWEIVVLWREEIHILQTYLDPQASYGPEAIGATAEEIRALIDTYQSAIDLLLPHVVRF